MAVERSRRWPPRQRMHLTPEGETARLGYQEVVREARGSGGKPGELDARLDAWAGTLGVRASDGVLLEELTKPGLSVNELARAVESCGQRAADVKSGVDRLYGAGLIQPPQVEQPAAPPTPPPWRT